MMEVTPQKLKEEKEKGTVMNLVDVQAADDYQHAHVPGAINVPVEEFESAFPSVLKDKDIAVVCYGEFDENGKGKKAADTLVASGYTKVGRLVGGLRAWQEAGYRTEGGQES